MQEWRNPVYNGKRPPWLTGTVPSLEALDRMYRLLRSGELNTVCDWASCPNLGECYRRGTATFMVLGHVCTRNCAFCAVPKGKPIEPDAREPENVARTVRHLGLRHVVVTSVTRDDLPDGGARHFARVIHEVRRLCPDTSVEVLIPDFQGSLEAISVVVDAGPDIIGHNLETIPRLYKEVRPKASYLRSLGVLASVKRINQKIRSKSSLMLGLAESEDELLQVLQDLRVVDCDFLTLGQYLPPTAAHHPVAEYIPPEKFDLYRDTALKEGFLGVFSGPLVRSSYRSEEMLQNST